MRPTKLRYASRKAPKTSLGGPNLFPLDTIDQLNAKSKDLYGFLQYPSTFRVALWIRFSSANVMFSVVKMSVSYIRELIFQENGLKNREGKG